MALVPMLWARIVFLSLSITMLVTLPVFKQVTDWTKLPENYKYLKHFFDVALELHFILFHVWWENIINSFSWIKFLKILDISSIGSLGCCLYHKNSSAYIPIIFNFILKLPDALNQVTNNDHIQLIFEWIQTVCF
jgi:hypothetical protein